ncbi:MAG: hypothetical protein MZW92_47750 [Comamonadaceae bacterium]|nr:hypothetical protein [Comamonadaceae bacterium]
MDHDSFRDARRVLNPRPCPFERAILARCCGLFGLDAAEHLGARRPSPAAMPGRSSTAKACAAP